MFKYKLKTTRTTYSPVHTWNCSTLSPAHGFQRASPHPPHSRRGHGKAKNPTLNITRAPPGGCRLQRSATFTKSGLYIWAKIKIKKSMQTQNLTKAWWENNKSALVQSTTRLAPHFKGYESFQLLHALTLGHTLPKGFLRGFKSPCVSN